MRFVASVMLAGFLVLFRKTVATDFASRLRCLRFQVHADILMMVSFYYKGRFQSRRLSLYTPERADWQNKFFLCLTTARRTGNDGVVSGDRVSYRKRRCRYPRTMGS